MSVHIDQAQVDILQYHLDTLYSRAAGYAFKLADLALDDAEQTLLGAADRKKAVAQALAAIQQTLEWDIVPDHAERACP